MIWTKKGMVFKPSGEFSWSKTHAQVPTALVLESCIRVYYSTRDESNRSRTSFIEVDKYDPSRILYIHRHPVMDLGMPGTHDEDGVMVGCVLQDRGSILLYYTGWSTGGTVPYRVSIGLAKSTDGGVTFERAFLGPVVDRTPLEAYMTMSPYVSCDGDVWHMWYGSGTGWVEIDGKQEPLYAVKYAQSDDGIVWQQDNVLCIEPLHPEEANTRPSVMVTSRGFEMWFSYRQSKGFRDGSGGYRIGYATSGDGRNWRRHEDPLRLAPDGVGWNGKMSAYPNVVEVNGKKLMFYNGDGFGRAGFGYCQFDNSDNNA